MPFASSPPLAHAYSLSCPANPTSFSAKYNYIVILKASVCTLPKSLFRNPFVARLEPSGLKQSYFISHLPKPSTFSRDI